MTMPIIPQAVPLTPEPSGPVGPGTAGQTPESSTVAAEFRAALATALGDTRPRRARVAKDGAPAPAAEAHLAPRTARAASIMSTGQDAPAPGGTEATPAITASTDEFTPVDLAAFLGVPVAPDESADPASTPADGSRTAPTALALAIAGTAVATGLPAPGPGSNTPAPTLDPRAVPSVPAMLAAPEATIALPEPARSPESLAPAFRERLERVVDRMERELGYTVEVVETVRSQERQDKLFAQGRSEPGPIVTWTRASNHTKGLAADVTVNGGWNDRAGFEALARVAREEGLRTLWPRDPGHIELAGLVDAGDRIAHTAPTLIGTGNTPAASITPRIPTEGPAIAVTPRVATPLVARGPDAPTILPMPSVPSVPEPVGLRPPVRPTTDDTVTILPCPAPSRDATIRPFVPPQVRGDGGAESRQSAVGLAKVAPVAAVAQVAPVASVAQVARVATPGESPRPAVEPTVREVARARRPGAPAAEAVTTATNAPITGDRVARVDVRDNGHDGEHRGREQGERREAREAASATLRDAESALLRATVSGDTGTGDRQGSELLPTGGIERSDAAERIARVLRVQESAAERPVSSVLLRLDHPEGGEDRVRVDLRGSTVGATIDVRDPVAADNLRAHAAELQAQLGRQGLESEAIAVRTMTRAPEPALGAAGALGAEREAVRTSGTSGSGTGSGSTAQRDPRAPWRDEAQARGQDHPNSRQRRDQRGTR